jgi:hypothetical protein
MRWRKDMEVRVITCKHEITLEDLEVRAFD